jgi:hypothetical protein
VQPVKCSFCTLFTATKLSQLRLHFIIHHEKTEQSVVKCTQCHLSFYSNYALKQHEKVCRKHKRQIDKEDEFVARAISVPKIPVTNENSLSPRIYKLSRKLPAINLTTTGNSSKISIPVAKDSESFVSILPDNTEEASEKEASELPTCEICELSNNRLVSFDLNNQVNSPCIGCGRNVNKQMRRKCGICERWYAIRAMQAHYKEYHADRKMIDCPINDCGRVFLSAVAMEQHKVYHTLKCACGEILKNHRALKTHRESCDGKGGLEEETVTLEVGENPLAKKQKSSKKRRLEDEEEEVHVKEEDPLSEVHLNHEEETKVQFAEKKMKVLFQQKQVKPFKLKKGSKVTKARGRPKKINKARLATSTKLQKVPAVQEDCNFNPLTADDVEFQSCEAEQIPPPAVTVEKRGRPKENGDPLESSKAIQSVISLHCDVCDFQNSKTAPAHDDPTTTCPKCKRTIKLTENIRMKLEKFKCSLCNFKTFDSGEIRNHISATHSRSRVVFQCNICLTTTDTERLLKEHNLKNHSFTCAICSTAKKFLRKEALDEHMKKHRDNTETMPSNCELIEIN